MLCELDFISQSFFMTWMLVSLLALSLVTVMSGVMFYLYYWPTNVTHEKWRYKSNPKFPSPKKVRDEIVTMCKGIICAAFCPTLALVLIRKGYGRAFCGWNDYSFAYHAMTFFIILIISDFYEFFYHRMGHVDFRFWKQHKHHHQFYNPSPFSVVADEWLDQFMRSLPLLVIPLLAPINMDMLFFQYGIFFYVYGVYLHMGYEWELLSAHNKYINTSFQHYCHHAKSLMNSPYHCGFFIKLWDQLFDCCYPEEKCFCAECARKKGERTEEKYKEIQVPDYAQLLKPAIWLEYFTAGKAL